MAYKFGLWWHLATCISFMLLDINGPYKGGLVISDLTLIRVLMLTILSKFNWSLVKSGLVHRQSLFKGDNSIKHFNSSPFHSIPQNPEVLQLLKLNNNFLATSCYNWLPIMVKTANMWPLPIADGITSTVHLITSEPSGAIQWKITTSE